MRTRPIDLTALTLLVIGAVNWGLVGFFQFDTIAALFGGMDAWFSRIVYAIIGICGLYSFMLYGRIRDGRVDVDITETRVR